MYPRTDLGKQTKIKMIRIKKAKMLLTGKTLDEVYDFKTHFLEL